MVTNLWSGTYLGTNEGGSVGLDHTPARFTDWEVMRHLDSRTIIPGLWLTGQDTVTCGQPISQGSGLITAMRMLGFWRSIYYLARTLPPIVKRVVSDYRAGVGG
jgi:phytoene dehydrogenase-like protein